MKYKLLIALLSINFGTLAQKIKIKDNIAYADDSVYCKISGNKGLLLAAHAEFTLLTMQDKELVYINQPAEQDYYEIVFLTTGQKAKLDAEKIGNNTKSNFVKLLYKNKVIDNGEINELGKKNFLAKYEMEPGTAGAPGSGTIIVRNDKADIYIINGVIRQDNKIIGKIKTSSFEGDDATLKNKYRLNLPDNTPVAEITAEQFNLSKNSGVTFKDNRQWNVSGISSSAAPDENAFLEKAVKYLISLKYL